MKKEDYFHEVSAIRDHYEADAVFILVVNGRKGTGGTLCTRSPFILEDISKNLLKVATRMKTDAEVNKRLSDALSKFGTDFNPYMN